MTIRDGRLSDFTAGHITSEEGKALVEAPQEKLGRSEIEFFPGVSYRNLMTIAGPVDRVRLPKTPSRPPPTTSPTGPPPITCPEGPARTSPRTHRRRGRSRPRSSGQPRSAGEGRSPANAIWLWGSRQRQCYRSSRCPRIERAILSAVDLVRGVGILAGWERIDVPGTTGYLDTDYSAKGRYGIEALKNHDIVCVHVEAPDEASHEGKADEKVKALERIDR